MTVPYEDTAQVTAQVVASQLNDKYDNPYGYIVNGSMIAVPKRGEPFITASREGMVVNGDRLVVTTSMPQEEIIEASKLLGCTLEGKPDMITIESREDLDVLLEAFRLSQYYTTLVNMSEQVARHASTYKKSWSIFLDLKSDLVGYQIDDPHLKAVVPSIHVNTTFKKYFNSSLMRYLGINGQYVFVLGESPW